MLLVTFPTLYSGRIDITLLENKYPNVTPLEGVMYPGTVSIPDPRDVIRQAQRWWGQLDPTGPRGGLFSWTRLKHHQLHMHTGACIRAPDLKATCPIHSASSLAAWLPSSPISAPHLPVCCCFRLSAAPGATVTALVAVPPFDRFHNFNHFQLRTPFPFALPSSVFLQIA